MSNSGRIPPLNVHRRGTLGAPLVAAQTWTCSRLTALYVRSLNIGGFKRTTSGGLRLRTYCTDLPTRWSDAEAHLTVKNERDLVIVLVGRRRRVPFDREIRQAGGD